MAINDRPTRDTKLYSLNHIANQGFDQEFQVPVTEVLGYDGVALQRMRANALNMKITTVSDITYIGFAAPGTAEATAKWQCLKIVSGDPDSTIKFADGDSNFDNVATDLTALSYS